MIAVKEENNWIKFMKYPYESVSRIIVDCHLMVSALPAVAISIRSLWRWYDMRGFILDLMKSIGIDSDIDGW
jgi:hypothetical protein